MIYRVGYTAAERGQIRPKEGKDKAEESVKSRICRIHLDFATEQSKMVNVAADVQNVLQLIFACPI